MELDVRQIPPRERHPRIFALFDRLMPGEGFVLVNDHDPKLLYYQFQAEHPGQVDWSYLGGGRARLRHPGPRPWAGEALDSERGLMGFWHFLFVRAALLYLVCAAFLGTLLYLFPGLVGPFRPSHVHAGLVGFFLQMVMGVAYWMMPRPRGLR
jgi:uncharacterized protein (DUF2249 family)